MTPPSFLPNPRYTCSGPKSGRGGVFDLLNLKWWEFRNQIGEFTMRQLDFERVIFWTRRRIVSMVLIGAVKGPRYAELHTIKYLN